MAEQAVDTVVEEAEPDEDTAKTAPPEGETEGQTGTERKPESSAAAPKQAPKVVQPAPVLAH